MGPRGFACGKLASVAHFNSELPKVSVFPRTAFLDQHPSLLLAGSLGKAASASGL